MLNDEYQSMAANAICHAAAMAGECWQQASYEATRPSAVYRPAIYPDGTQWCALYGKDLQEGVAGFGDTPSAAMYDFDKNWLNQKLPLNRPGSQT